MISFLRRTCGRLRSDVRPSEVLGSCTGQMAGRGWPLLSWRSFSADGLFETIRAERRDAVQILTLNRPEKMNALSSQCCSELLECLKKADTDPDTRVTVLTGSGKVFCAGADIKEMSQWTKEQVGQEQKFYEWTDIQALRKPTIAAVNGAAIAGGCELAMLCDIIIASENAHFSQPEPNVGLIPGMGGTQRLIHAVGKSKAMEMILAGDVKGLTASEALQYGLVSRVVAEGMVLEEAMKIAQRIATRSGPIIMKAKQCINSAYEMGALHGTMSDPFNRNLLGLTEALKSELKEFWSCFAYEDSKEGLRAFLEKREPDFKHR